MNGIFRLLAWCGFLCFLGLARSQPLRGAIEVAWGVELHPGEIYGPVVARAYELESQVAQHPRIVVGPGVVDMLNVFSVGDVTDIASQADREMAKVCLQLIGKDLDGADIVHYLGRPFGEVMQDARPELYKRARLFIGEQLQEHRQRRNYKLAIRYANLMHYFDTYSSSQAEAAPN